MRFVGDPGGHLPQVTIQRLMNDFDISKLDVQYAKADVQEPVDRVGRSAFPVDEAARCASATFEDNRHTPYDTYMDEYGFVDMERLEADVAAMQPPPFSEEVLQALYARDSHQSAATASECDPDRVFGFTPNGDPATSQSVERDLDRYGDPEPCVTVRGSDEPAPPDLRCLTKRQRADAVRDYHRELGAASRARVFAGTRAQTTGETTTEETGTPTAGQPDSHTPTGRDPGPRPLVVGKRSQNDAETGQNGTGSVVYEPVQKWKRPTQRTVQQAEPAGYIKTSHQTTKGVRSWAAARFTGSDLTADSQRLVLHVLSCQGANRDNGGYVPVHCRLRQREVPGAPHDLLVAEGWLEYREHDRGAGLSREYRVPAALLADYVSQLHSIEPGDKPADLMSDKRITRKPKPATTQTRDPLTGERYTKTMIDAMRAIADGQYDRARVDRHVAQLEVVYRVAEAQATAACSMPFTQASSKMQAYRRAARQAERQRLDTSPAPFTDAQVDAISAAERALARWTVDAEVRVRLLNQTTEHVHGNVYRYVNAHKPQSTGRMSDVGSLLQSSTRAMKQAAWGHLDGVYNYDLASSQPKMLTVEFGKAGVSTESLDALLAVGKREHAVAVGVTIDGWKKAWMAVVMGAKLFPSSRAAATPWGEHHGEVSRIIEAHAVGDWRESYDLFRERVAAVYADLQLWHTWLVKTWAPAAAVRGNHGHLYVTNDAGATFNLTTSKASSVGRKLAAHVLQGREAAFIREIVALGTLHGYTVIANEHDGVVVAGEIPEAAVAAARDRTGMDDAELVVKSFLQTSPIDPL